MKRVISIFLAFVLTFYPILTYSGWLDTWFDQQVSSGPDYYESQKRGYVTFGSFSGRVNTSSPTYPFSFEPPRIRAGCGGIDIFLGSFGFANPEYLIQKLQNLIQAAPVIAFQLALKTLSSSLSETVDKVMSTLDFLNQLQLDECKLLHPFFTVDTSKVQGNTVLERLKSIATQVKEGYVDMYRKAREQFEDKAVTRDEVSKNLRENCPSVVSAIYERGSLIEYAGNTIGLDSDLRSAIRTVAGDLKIGTGSNNTFNVFYISPKLTPEDLEKGVDNIKLTNVNGELYDKPLNFTNKVRNSLIRAYQAKLTKTDSPADYVILAKYSPIALEHMMNVAVLTKNPTFVESIAPTVAQGVFYNLISHILSKAIEVASSIPSNSNPTQCPSQTEVATAVEKMRENAIKNSQLFYAVYEKYLRESSTTYDFALKFLQYMNFTRERLVSYYSPTVVSGLLGGTTSFK